MKRIISLLLALVIAISAAVPAYATGDGNFDGGGGSMGDGTKTNYWNPGMDGVRVSIVDVGSHSVVRTPIDLTNKVPIANIAHFGKVSKLSYNVRGTPWRASIQRTHIGGTHEKDTVHPIRIHDAKWQNGHLN